MYSSACKQDRGHEIRPLFPPPPPPQPLRSCVPSGPTRGAPSSSSRTCLQHQQGQQSGRETGQGADNRGERLRRRTIRERGFLNSSGLERGEWGKTERGSSSEFWSHPAHRAEKGRGEEGHLGNRNQVKFCRQKRCLASPRPLPTSSGEGNRDCRPVATLDSC